MTYTRSERKTTVSWAAGSYATPAAEATHEVFGVSFDPERSDVIAPDTVVGRYHKGHRYIGGRYSQLVFNQHLIGQSALGTAPVWGALLRGCGFYESTTGASAGVYAYKYEQGNPHLASTLPTSSGEAALDPLDIRVNYDSLDYLCENMVGRVKLNFTAGQLPYFMWEFRGQVATGATATASGYTETAPATTFTQGSLPVPVQNEGLQLLLATSTYTPASVKSIEIDFGNMLDPRNDLNGDMGYGQPVVPGFDPVLTLVVEADLLASWNPDSSWAAGTMITLNWTHNSGGTAGSVIACQFIGKIGAQPVPSYINGTRCVTLTLDQYNGQALPYLQVS